MYSQKVIDRAIATYEAKADHRLVHIENGKRDDWRTHLEARLVKAGDLPTLNTSLTKEERLFIRNERVLSMLDFSYWCHYATIQRDGGGITNFDHPWQSSRILLAFVAQIEQEQHDAIARVETDVQRPRSRHEAAA